MRASTCIATRPIDPARVLGRYDYAQGAQEQWVWQLGPQQRSYAYVDVATRRVTGWHR